MLRQILLSCYGNWRCTRLQNELWTSSTWVLLECWSCFRTRPTRPSRDSTHVRGCAASVRRLGNDLLALRRWRLSPRHLRNLGLMSHDRHSRSRGRCCQGSWLGNRRLAHSRLVQERRVTDGVATWQSRRLHCTSRRGSMSRVSFYAPLLGGGLISLPNICEHSFARSCRVRSRSNSTSRFRALQRAL